MSDRLTFRGTINASAAKQKRLRILAYAGGTITPDGGRDWGLVVVALDGVSLPPTIPILQDHDNRVRALAGSGVPRVQGSEIWVEGPVADSAAGREIVALISSGANLQASVGLHVTKTRLLRAGETARVNGQMFTAPDGGLTVIERSELKEVSVVPIGADANTKVSLAARAARGNKMDFHDWLKDKGFDPTNLSDDQRDALLAGYNSEQAIKANASGEPEAILQASLAAARTGALRAAITRAAEEHPDKLDTVERLGREALTAGWSPERLELSIYRETATQVDNHPRASRGPSRDVLRAAMERHAGIDISKHFDARTCQQAEDLGVRHVLDVAELCIRAAGQTVPRSKDEVIRAATMLRASGPSTYDLATALGDTAHRALLLGYQTIPPTWRSWVKRKSVSDFRNHTEVRLLSGSGLEQLPAGGEVKHGKLNDQGFTHSATTYGQLLVIDRRDLINDDISILSDIPRLQGLEAARLLADLVYRTLLANASNFFGTDHANFDDGSDSALSAEALEAAVTAFRQQTDPNGRTLDVAPRVLVVPPQLEFDARRLLNSVLVDRTAASADLAPTGNPLAGMFQLEVEGRLSNTAFTGASQTGWYLMASPDIVPVGIASFLNGVENPVIRQVDQPPNYVGMAYQCIFDAGFNLADYRGGYKGAGA